MLPQTVNAYYNPGTNEICFPAGILQKPFFDPDADPAENYGGIGAVIGHEIGHGFDDQGAQYDGQGNLNDWWTADDKAAFELKSKALIDQYDGFEPRNLPGEHVNGALTVGENIGDLGGLTIALKAYLISLGGAAGARARGPHRRRSGCSSTGPTCGAPSAARSSTCSTSPPTRTARRSSAPTSCATSTSSTTRSARVPVTGCGSTRRTASGSGDPVRCSARRVAGRRVAGRPLALPRLVGGGVRRLPAGGGRRSSWWWCALSVAPCRDEVEADPREPAAQPGADAASSRTPGSTGSRPAGRRSMGAPFGEVLAGVGYDYDQWLHLYGIERRRARVHQEQRTGDRCSTRTRSRRGGRCDRPASGSRGTPPADRFLLLDLSATDATRVSAYDVADGHRVWCARAATRSTATDDPVSTTFLDNGDVLTALPDGNADRA